MVQGHHQPAAADRLGLLAGPPRFMWDEPVFDVQPGGPGLVLRPRPPPTASRPSAGARVVSSPRRSRSPPRLVADAFFTAASSLSSLDLVEVEVFTYPGFGLYRQSWRRNRPQARAAGPGVGVGGSGRVPRQGGSFLGRGDVLEPDEDLASARSPRGDR